MTATPSNLSAGSNADSTPVTAQFANAILSTTNTSFNLSASTCGPIRPVRSLELLSPMQLTPGTEYPLGGTGTGAITLEWDQDPEQGAGWQWLAGGGTVRLDAVTTSAISFTVTRAMMAADGDQSGAGTFTLDASGTVDIVSRASR